MIRLIVIFWFTISVLSCSDVNKIKEDTYNSGKELRITVHTYKNREALIKATKKYKTQDEVGLAVWNNKDNKCDIHVIEVKSINSSQFKTWGHELGHCVMGSFH